MQSVEYSSKVFYSQQLALFLKEKGVDNNYQCWSVSASSYYAKETLYTFKECKLRFFEKNINSPHVPEMRPIEESVAQTKLKVLKNDWPTDFIPKL